MIDHVKIESDEDGFHLIVDGEIEFDRDDWVDDDGVVFTKRPLNFLLSQGSALDLLRAARETIEPWAAEGEKVREDFERYKRTGQVPDYAAAAERGFLDPVEFGHGLGEIDGSENLREAADLERKRRRENP